MLQEAYYTIDSPPLMDEHGAGAVAIGRMYYNNTNTRSHNQQHIQILWLVGFL
jgi:hypothetical protein